MPTAKPCMEFKITGACFVSLSITPGCQQLGKHVGCWIGVSQSFTLLLSHPSFAFLKAKGRKALEHSAVLIKLTLF